MSELQRLHQNRPKVEMDTLQVTKSTICEGMFNRYCNCCTASLPSVLLVLVFLSLLIVVEGEGRNWIIPKWPLSSQQFTGIPWLIDHATPEISSSD